MYLLPQEMCGILILLTPPQSSIQLIFYTVLSQIHFCRSLSTFLGKIILTKTLFVF